MSIVEVSHLAKRFGQTQAVADVSFEVGPGEIFGLLGPNGAGKTTTIRMMLDIFRPDAGTVHILGGALDEAKKHRIGYMPEERGLYKDQKLEPTLVYLATLKGMTEAAARARLPEWLKRLDLWEHRTKKVQELSKGMQQKAQLIATLLHEPELIVVDEPFQGLDPVNTRLIQQIFEEQRRAGKCILMSTHQMYQVEALCDRIVLINAGRTVLYGQVAEIRLGDRTATIVGVLEPSVPYPAETEIIANVVTSPHHLSATMVDGPRASDDGALRPARARRRSRGRARRAARGPRRDRARSIPRSYPASADFRIDAVRLRDQITSPARTVLLVLLAASALVFIIACSNVANLILARSVRREGELAIRAALGASAGALRRTLLAESLLLCGAGAILGVVIARPMVAVLAPYAARFSVRALDLTVDASLLWVGVGLAVAAAVLLAFVPRLPSADAASGLGLSTGSVRITSGTNRRLRALCRHADRRVVRAPRGRRHAADDADRAADGADRLQHAQRARAERARDVATSDRREQVAASTRKRCGASRELPGVERVAVGHGRAVARRRRLRPGLPVLGRGLRARPNGEEDPRARFRTVSPGFFAALGVPIIAGRDFNDGDRRDAEPVVIVSQSVAQRMFPTRDALNRRLMWTDPVMKFIDVSTEPRRIVGVAADVDDENVVPGPAHDACITRSSRRSAAAGSSCTRRPTRMRSCRRSRASSASSRAGAAGGAGRDARRHPRGGAGAGPAERARVRRVRGRRADHRRGRRGRRAGVLGERADARVRHPPGDRSAPRHLLTRVFGKAR